MRQDRSKLELKKQRLLESFTACVAADAFACSERKVSRELATPYNHLDTIEHFESHD
jgi:hypothetical protein